MKKLIYVALVTLTLGISLSSCTEEEVKPSTVMNGGGGGLDGKK